MTHKLTDAELLNAFADLFDEIEFDDEEVDEILREAGYDPDEVGKEIQRIAEDTLAQVKRKRHST